MANDLTTLKLPGLEIYFQSNRAHVDGKVPSRLSAFIKAAKKSLDVAIYDLKDPDVLAALAAMKSKVKLRIAYDGGKKKVVAPNAHVDPKPKGMPDLIKAYGLAAHATAIHVQGGKLMHDKFIVRDGKTVWSGSGNFTYGGLVLQDNNFLVLHSPELAVAYTRAFEALLGNGTIPAPTTVKIGNVRITQHFTTGHGEVEGIEAVVVRALAGVKKLRLMAMLASDPGILGSLDTFKPKARNVRGVLDPHEMKQVMHPPHGKSKTPPALFWFADGDARFVAAPSHAFSDSDNNDFMHDKVMILDGKKVITGSYNFSESAEANNEAMMVIESADVARAYEKYFDVVFAEYQKHGAALPPQ